MREEGSEISVDRSISEFKLTGKDLLLQFIDLLARGGVRLPFFIIPIALSIAAAIFEGLTMALLVPLLDAVLLNSEEAFKKLDQALSFVSLDFLSAFEYGIFGVLTVLVLASAALKLVCSYLGQLSILALARKFLVWLRVELFSKYLDFGKLYIDSKSLGYFFHILIYDTEAVAEIFLRLQSAIQGVALVLVYGFLMFYISWPLALFSALLLPILYISLKRIISSTKSISEEQSVEMLGLAREIQNIMGNAPLIKSYANETREIERFDVASKTIEKLRLETDRRNLLIPPVNELIMLLFLIAVVGLIYVFLMEEAGVASLAAVFVLLLRRAGMQISMVAGFMQALAGASGPIQNIIEMASLDGKHTVEDGDVKLTKFSDSIEFKNVSFSYLNGRKALTDVSIVIERGQRVALVGETGAGKSTLMQLLLRFFDPKDGVIMIDGYFLKDVQLSSWRGLVSYVSQDALLFNDSLRKNITYGIHPEPNDAQVTAALNRAQLSELMSALPKGLDTDIGDKGVKLSGGEKQRIAIARAFLKDSPIILLDEPTSALDAGTEALIQAAMDELLEDRTVLIIAHRLSTIKEVDKVIVMESGQIIERGSLSDLLENEGAFHRLWIKQHGPIV